MLAGVANKDDLANVRAAAGQERFTAVGVFKKVRAVLNDEKNMADKKNGWKTLDGERVQNNVWATGQPDNKRFDDGGVETYAVYDYKNDGLIDVVNYSPPALLPENALFNKAVMRCCAKGYIPKTFCEEEEV